MAITITRKDKAMKKIIRIVTVTALSALFLFCGNVDSADIGVRITAKVPAHGHNNALDGGVLKLSNTIVTMSSTTLPLAPGPSSFSCIDTQYTGTIVDRLSLYTAPAFSIRIPVGYSYVKATAHIVVSMSTYTHDIAAAVRITKNAGLTSPDCFVTTFAAVPTTLTANNDITYTIPLSCPYIAVAENDTLGTAICNGSRTGSLFLEVSRSWVSFELFR